ncbi:MAG: LPXTG cell wall anchor domain-containing protein [Actinobacteria bacterium]|uniref:Unannotated protein n=1 Tax=freshwater metagenome TaxID=449393 RepID=A0A6J7EWI5_9ZZZZ|nr:LPXTG cell wall anchor domain-containing protein [Actinomycetota bacterium]
MSEPASRRARRIISRIGVLAAGIAAAAFTAPTAADANVDARLWGAWSAADVTNAPVGRIAFANTSVGGADYAFTVTAGSPTASIDGVSAAGEWFTAQTAPGAAFGGNGPSASANTLTLSGSGTNATTTITFDQPVPANKLALVISDLDSTNASDPSYSDRVTVTATTGSATSLTSAQLQGAAAGAELFNFCNVTVNADMPSDCAGTVATAVPVMRTPTPTSVYFYGDISTSSPVGDSAWLAPSQEVKTLIITWSSYASTSDIRLYLAVTADPPPAPLPNTGFDVGATALTGLVLGLLGAGALIAVSRRA